MASAKIHCDMSASLVTDVEEKRSAEDHEDAMYEEGRVYWANVSANVDGMLGGFSEVHGADISASRRFLAPFIHGQDAITGCNCALDCGAGIGRITKHLLSELFENVDMLEQNSAFLDEARKSYLGDKSTRVSRYICSGLQDFIPEPKRYDVIWVQWVLSHLPDAGVQRFLNRIVSGLRDNGLLVIKENVLGRHSDEEVEQDVHDVTITRTRQLIRDMVGRAGFAVIKELRQTKFPPGLYEVRMFACRPTEANQSPPPLPRQQ